MPRERPEPPRPVFHLSIQFTGDPAFEVHALRRLLKQLIRGHRFRVVDLREGENKGCNTTFVSRGQR